MDTLERIEALQRLSHSEFSSRSREIQDQLHAFSPEAKWLVDELSDIRIEELVRGEDEAVRLHGRQILAAIEGTTWASDGDVSTATVDDSSLVRLLDRVEEAS